VAAAPSPVIVGSILVGADEMVAAMVAARIPNISFGEYTALGVVRHGKLVGGVVYHNYVEHDIQVSIAVDGATFMPWRGLFAYPFEQLGCSRITAMIGRKNKKSRKMCELLGFRLEGVHPKGLDGTQDAMSYGLLKEHCRWIKDRSNGQENASRTAAA
jgi:RimJ/RimL family protein N-acetyltransferase